MALQKIILIISITLINYFTNLSYSQDTTYISLFVNNEEITIDKNFIIEIQSSSEHLLLPVFNNEFIITPKISTVFNLILNYEGYNLVFKKEPPWILKNSIHFNIDTFPFDESDKMILFKKNKYLYHYTLSANMSKSEGEKHSGDGILYSVLTSKIYKGKIKPH